MTIAAKSATGRGLEGLLRLTDDTGILQHSRFAIPDRSHGYCIDDNARALMLMAIDDDIPTPLRRQLTHRYAAFVEHSWNENTSSFRNFMGYSRHWLERSGSPDSNGRTLWALATVEESIADIELSSWAATLFDQTIGHMRTVSSPRTAAFLILALCRSIKFRGNPGPVPNLLADSAAYLLRLFREHSSTQWTWFEPYLSYDNYRLPEAMVVASELLGEVKMREAGIAALRWLAMRQTGPNGIFRPVSTAEFGVAHAVPALFDQQPVEAWAAIDASIVSQTIAPDDLWLAHGEAAFAWFTGANDANAALGSTETGECYDGIGKSGVNKNRGAESVLAWLFAQRRIKTLRALITP